MAPENPGFVIQGSFPGGRPHSTVLLENRSDYLSLAESARTVQALMRHPNKFIIQRKLNDFQRENIAVQCYSESNNIKAYPLNIARLNFQSEGCPIEDDVLQLYEGVFNKNLCDVKIHAGSGEAEALGAIAFTLGKDIYFSKGMYTPHTPEGQKLLGHELTHVIQQKQGRVKNPFGGNAAVIYNPGLEAEAERMGLQMCRIANIDGTGIHGNIVQKMQAGTTAPKGTATLNCYITWKVRKKSVVRQQKFVVRSKIFYSGQDTEGWYYYQKHFYEGGPAFHDAEMKLVSWLYCSLSNQQQFNPDNAYGDITITTAFGPCDDCKMAIKWLGKRLPHINVEVKYKSINKISAHNRYGEDTEYGYEGATGTANNWEYIV